MMTIVAEYSELSDALARAGIVLALPELHGGICGAICAGGTAAMRRWVDECVLEQHKTAAAANEVSRELHELEAATWQQLADVEMTFEPLLPDEESPLDDQVQALALWCQGFLAGLGFGGLELGREPGPPPGEIEEILEDFAEISRAGLTDEERSDRNQADFALAELKEYVRVSVQIVFEALGAAHERAAGDSIH